MVTFWRKYLLLQGCCLIAVLLYTDVVNDERKTLYFLDWIAVASKLFCPKVTEMSFLIVQNVIILYVMTEL